MIETLEGKPMTKDEFQEFANNVDWTFAKSIPNWPHFYVVEEELGNPGSYAAARTFIRDHGYDGHFFDLVVRYYDVNGWTYWSSPLAKPFVEQYMINRCRTEYTWDALSKAGELPPEGFEGKILSLTPVLEDPEFQALARSGKTDGEIETCCKIAQHYGKLFHALPHLMGEDSIRDQCSAAELSQLEAILAAHQEPGDSTEIT
jgi:hypothetical protein